MAPKYDYRVHQYLYNVVLGESIRQMDEFVLNGADVNYVDDNGISTLMYACRWGKPVAAKYLIEHGANVNYYNEKSDKTVLMDAKQNCFELLLSHGADINATDKRGLSILTTYMLYDFADKEIFELLIKHGADIEIRNHNNKSLYDIAKGISGKPMKNYELIRSIKERLESEKAFSVLSATIENKHEISGILF